MRGALADVQVTGRALRPTPVDTDAEGGYVRIQRTGTRRVALARVAVRP
ncbi:hypothetical protein [Streptomyces spiralis]|nr:hypothetical protein [Streptomyces spiralis]